MIRSRLPALVFAALRGCLVLAAADGCNARVSLGGAPDDGGAAGEAGSVAMACPGGASRGADGGCVLPGGPLSPEEACQQVIAASLEIRRTNCAPCHDGAPVAQGAFSTILDDSQLIGVESAVIDVSTGKPYLLVDPGNPDGSFVYIRANAGLAENPTRLAMPPASVFSPRPTASDVSVLRSWIECLGPAPGGTITLPDAAAADTPGPTDATADGEAASPVIADATTTPPPDYDATPPPGLAGFAFVFDGIVQQPLSCPSENWEFDPVDRQGQRTCDSPGSCDWPDGGPSVRTAIVNTGAFPIAYYAAAVWNGTGYVPGVLTGGPQELAGVLAPGQQVDITGIFGGGTVALVGSAARFSSADAGKYASDEGSIPWPAGVSGGGGASTMWIAEIEIRQSCGLASRAW